MVLDKEALDALEFILGNTFYHVPAGVRKTGDFAGETYDEFWWRGCVLHEGDMQGTQGYMIVWFDKTSGKLVHHHTYRNPENMY